ncbi:hypothetical protein WB861_004586 [Vibrio parahaemolyticus]|nr:hypothetical protein [Vibrio parahaemolyticus]
MIEDFEKIWCDFVDFRTEFTQDLHFRDQHSKFVLAYWARVNSLCSEIMVLIKNGCYTSIPIIMRSYLESLVDLRCLIIDSSYIEQVFAAESESEYKHMKQYSDSNPYYLGSSPVSAESLDILKPVKRSLGIADKFKKAGCEELYSTVYNQLCRHTHGNITALASKNFENETIVLSSRIKDSELLFILSSTVNAAVLSTHDLLEFYDLDDVNLKRCLGFSERVKKLSKKFV